jgi:hypothetical protein
MMKGADIRCLLCGKIIFSFLLCVRLARTKRAVCKKKSFFSLGIWGTHKAPSSEFGKKAPLRNRRLYAKMRGQGASGPLRGLGRSHKVLP